MSESTTQKVVKKVAKKVVKKVADHPTYLEMIITSIAALKERKGSSRQAILKHIVANYKVKDTASTHVKLALKRGVATGALKQVKGTGASGSFKLAEKPKKAKKKAPLKKAKKPAAKKPAAKKAVNKTPKKAKKAKKVAAKKPAAKKAKKPAAKKPAAKKPAKKAAKKKAAKK